jgi:hypothetical protein
MASILDEPIAPNPHHYRPCYHCNKIDYKKVTSTWWGGILGPKLLNHVKCNNCGTTYNGKTGQSNLNAILFYTGSILLVTMFLLYGLSLLGLL